MAEESEIFLSGKKFISSKRAASITGYTNDYIGQLCRAGKIESQMVGRNRFVEEESLLSYSKSTSAEPNNMSIIESRRSILMPLVIAMVSLIFLFGGYQVVGGYSFGKLSSIQDSINSVSKSTYSKVTSVSNTVGSVTQKIDLQNATKKVANHSKNIFESLGGSLNNAVVGLSDSFNNITVSSKKITDGIGKSFDNVSTSLSNASRYFTASVNTSSDFVFGKFNSVKNFASNINSRVASAFDGVKNFTLSFAGNLNYFSTEKIKNPVSEISQDALSLVDTSSNFITRSFSSLAISIFKGTNFVQAKSFDLISLINPKDFFANVGTITYGHMSSLIMSTNDKISSVDEKLVSLVTVGFSGTKKSFNSLGEFVSDYFDFVNDSTLVFAKKEFAYFSNIASVDDLVRFKIRETKNRMIFAFASLEGKKTDKDEGGDGGGEKFVTILSEKVEQGFGQFFAFKNVINTDSAKVASEKFNNIVDKIALGMQATVVLSVEQNKAQLQDAAQNFAINFYRTISGLFGTKTTTVLVDNSVNEITTTTTQPSTQTQETVVKTVTIPTTTVVNPIQERIVEKQTQTIVSGVTLADLQLLENRLKSEMYKLTDNNTTQITNVYQTVAHTNKIDMLDGVAISNASISNSTFSGTTGSFGSLTLSGSLSGASASFSGGLSTAGNLSITGTATSTASGDFAFDSNTLYIDSINNRVGIGTTSPVEKLAINGALYLSSVSTPVVTANRLYNVSNNLYWDGVLLGGSSIGNWTASSTDVYRSTGNVGIGTTTPGFKLGVNGSFGVVGESNLATTTINGTLQVNGNTYISEGGMLNVGDKIISPGEIGLGTSTPRAKLSIQNTSASQTALLVYGTTTQTSPFFDVWSNPTTNLNLFRVAYDGNIGIGTSSPYAKLSVAGNAVFTGGLTLSSINATSTTATSTFAGGISLTTLGRGIQLPDGSFINSSNDLGKWSSNGSKIYYNTDNVGIGTTSPFAKLSVENTGSGLSFAVNDEASDASPFVIDASGKVGIGTTTPSASLDIQGTDYLLRLGYDGDTGVKMKVDASGGLYIDSNADNSVSITTSYGDSANAALRIAGGATNADWSMGTNKSAVGGAADSFFFYKGAGTVGTKLVIQDNGNIGIGTTSPYARLAVVGTAVAKNFVATSTTATSTFAGGLAVGISNLVVDRITGNVGVKTSDPSSYDVFGNNAHVAPDFVVNGRAMFSYTEATSTFYRPVGSNMRFTVTPDSSVAQLTDYHGLDVVQTTASSNMNTFTQLYPLEVTGKYEGNDTIKGIYALYPQVNNSGNGTVQTGVNLRVFAQNTGTGEISTWKGISVENPTNNGGGTIGNGYGIYVNDITSASGNNYGIYSLANHNYINGLDIASSTITTLHGSLTFGDSGANNTRLNANSSNYLQTTAYLIGKTSNTGFLYLSGGVDDTSANLLMYGKSNSTKPNEVYLQNSSKFVVNSGSVGVASTTPFAKLSVENTGSGLSFAVNDEANDASPFVIDASGNVGVGTISPASKIHGVTTLSAATGDEIAYQLNYTTNKATSGNDTGLLINQTDTASPGTSYLIDAQVGGVSKFNVNNLGNVFFEGTINVDNVNRNSNSTLGIQQQSFGSADNAVEMSTGTFSNTTGQSSAVAILPIYNQASGDGANTDLLINRTQTAVGSGAQYLIDAQVGGSSKFYVKNDGITYATGGFKTTTVDSSFVSSGSSLSLTSGSTGSVILKQASTNTETSGQITQVKITPTYNQTSGTAANTDLLINRTETAVGSGSQYLIDAQVGGSSKFVITNTGNVGIGTTSPWRKLSVNGTAAFTALTNDGTGYYACVNATTGELATSTTACGASSERYKTNIQDLTYGLDTVMQLNPVSFDWKEDFIKNGTHQIGLIAEQVAPIIPEVIGHDNNGNIMNLDYPKLTAVLVNAVKELNAKVTNFVGSSTATVVDGVQVSMDSIVTYFENLGLKFVDGVAYLKDLVVNTLKADKVVTNGIEMTDDVTGEVYCVRIKNGVMVNVPGSCSSSSVSASDSESRDTSDEVNGQAVQDNPTIQILGNNPSQIQLNSTYIDLGVIAQDSNGNDLSVKVSVFASGSEAIQENINVSDISLDTSTTTTYTIQYNTTDGNGLTATAEREVTVGNPTDSQNNTEQTQNDAEEDDDTATTTETTATTTEAVTEPTCDSDNLNLCTTQSQCESISAYWYNDICNPEEEQTASTTDETASPAPETN